MSFADEMRIFDESGNRLYLDETERNRFINAVKQIDSPEKRLFAEVIFWTGCRLMEAAELTANSIQVENKAIVFRTLKRRVKQRNGKNIKPHFRVVPVPVELIESIDLVFQVRKKQRQSNSERLNKLFWPNTSDVHRPMARATAWAIIKKAMNEANIKGKQATAKGLRHSFGVTMTLAGMDVFKLRDLLGHASAETTQIYRQASGKDAHAYQMQMWQIK